MIRHTSLKHSKIFNIYNNKSMVMVGHKSIENCMKLLLLTSKGELLGDPNYGSNLMKLLYEPCDMMTYDLIAEDIVQTIEKYMPIVKTSTSMIDFLYVDENTLNIKINYYLLQIQELRNLVLTIEL